MSDDHDMCAFISIDTDLRRGRRFVRSTLNWGPVDFINSAGLTSGWWTRRRQDFSDDFHTFVLEWTPEFLNCYVDSPRNLMLGLKFDKPFYERGNYPGTAQNGTHQVILKDPWAISGANSAPFDKDFYLIMNVAIGGRNGWFPDTLGGKMWFDGSDSKNFRTHIVRRLHSQYSLVAAMYDFAKAKNQWFPTWAEDVTQRGMAM